MGFIVLLICGCVWQGFYRFVDIWLCVAGFMVFLIFDCVLHGFCCVVDV